MNIIDHLAGFVPGSGLYRMPADAYHADCAPEPSLSSSIAKMLLSQSPEHVRIAHPRLACQDEPQRDPTRPQEIGTATHKLILDRGATLVMIDAADYRTTAAKTARAEAYAAGHSPILAPDLETAEAIASRALERLARVPGCEGFASAPSEVVAVVRDPSGAWLRIMMDRVEIHERHAVIWDVKTGEQSAAPQGLGRRIESMGMEVQAALYVRVLGLLFPRLQGRIDFRWIFAENEPPHACTAAEVDPHGLAIGGRKVDAAIHLWNRCCAADEWPGYPSQILRVDYPEWAANRWTERETLDPTLADVVYDLGSSPHRPLEWERAA